MSSSAALGYFPDDRGGILKKVDNWPTGYSNDGIFGYIVDTGDKYIRTKKGILNCEEVGIYANGSDMTARINTVFAHAWVKEIEFCCEQGGDILITGTVTIPNTKTYSVKSGTRFNITGSGQINGGLVKADDTTQVWMGTKKVVPYGPAGRYWSAGWWGLVADGGQTSNGAGGISFSGTDNWDSLQKALTCSYTNTNRSYELQIPSGSYRISKPLIAYGLTAFVTFSMIGQKDSTWFPASIPVNIMADFRNTFALGIQRGKGCNVNGIIFSGLFYPPHAFDGNAPAYYALKSTQFVADGSRDNIYSPYSGIVIDPFTNTGIYPGKSGNTDVPDINNCYPGLEPYYLDVKADQYSGSSGINIENCLIQGFVVGYIISPNGQTLNGEACNVKQVQFGYHKVAYAACQSQSRNNYIQDCICWGGVHTVVDNITYAKYPQKGCAPYIEGFNIAGTNIRIFNILNDTWYGLFVKGMIVESALTIGVLNGSMPIDLQDCEFKFIFGAEYNGAGVRTYNYHLISGWNVTFRSCSIRYYGIDLPIVLYSPGTTFEQCVFGNVPWSPSLFSSDIETATIFKSCWAGSYQFGEDHNQRCNIGGNPAAMRRIIPAGRTVIHEAERETTVTGCSYLLEYNNSQCFGRRYLGNVAVTVNADNTATFIYNSQDTLPVYVGDYISDFFTTMPAWESGDAIPFPLIGQVTAINPTTKQITLTNIPLYLTSSTVFLAAFRPAPANIPFVANSSGSNTVTSVECFTKIADETSVTVRAFPSVGDTYLTPELFYWVIAAVDSTAKTITFDMPMNNALNDFQFINHNPNVIAKLRTRASTSGKEFLKSCGLLFAGMKVIYEGYDDANNPNSSVQIYDIVKPGYHEYWKTKYPSGISRAARFRRDGTAVIPVASASYQVEGWEDKIRVDCTNNSVALIVGYIAGTVTKTIELERIDSSANTMSVTVNNDGGVRTVNGGASYTVAGKKASLLLYTNNSVLVQESGSGTGGGAATRDTFTTSVDTSRPVAAGKYLLAIIVTPTGPLTSFKIGTAAGLEDLGSSDDIAAGVQQPFTIGTPFATTANVYFTNISSSTAITLITL